MAALVTVKPFICCLCPALSLTLLCHAALICVHGAVSFDIGSELETEVSGEFVSGVVELGSHTRVDESSGIGVLGVHSNTRSVEVDVFGVLRTTDSVLNDHTVFGAVTSRPLRVE